MELGSIGMFFQISALILSLASVAAYAYTYFIPSKLPINNNTKAGVFSVNEADKFNKLKQNGLKLGNILFIATTISIVIASCILFIAFAISDFSIDYVAKYSDSSLPMFYKISAFWGGQAGSLLLWVLLLVIFGVIEIFRIKNMNERYQLGVMLIMAGTTLFFTILVSFLQNPFEPARRILLDGIGLNPLLQNPGMVIHPPTLYVGYVGFTVITAHSFGAILSNDFSSTWLKMARPWSMIIWAFLTIGIVIGAWWAYVELGWGGYWAWDPVENASLMPWVTATAFLHSAYVYEKVGKLKIFTFILLIITFELTILGTFITRSGLIDSVHSFSPHPIGYYFLVYIVISAVVYLIMLIQNKEFKNIVKHDEEDFKFLSRTGFVLISNWFFIALTIAIAFGTLLPIVTGSNFNITYYNRATAPFFFLIFAASGFGLLTGFKISNMAKYRFRLIASLLTAVAGIIIMVILGYTQKISLFLCFSIYFSGAAVLIRIFTSFKSKGKVSIKSANRFYGAMIIHLGLVIIAFGIVISSFYMFKGEYSVTPGAVLDYKDYKFEVGSHASIQEQNYIAEYVPIKIYKNDKLITTAFPEMRIYSSHSEQVYREVAYYSQFTGDLYFALYTFNQDGSMVILFIHQPFVSWIWVGCLIMAIGAVFGAFSFRRKEENNDDKKSYLVTENNLNHIL